MLLDALAKLLKEKDFAQISIGDLAHQSTLNRATFYSHYNDKQALLENLVEEQFQRVVTERKIEFNGCDGALRSTALGVCYFLMERLGTGGNDIRQANGPIETAIVAVVRRLLSEGFSQHPPKAGTPLQLLCSTVAWAIYGAALQWAEHPDGLSVEQAGSAIEKLIQPLLTEIS